MVIITSFLTFSECDTVSVKSSAQRKLSANVSSISLLLYIFPLLQTPDAGYREPHPEDGEKENEELAFFQDLFSRERAHPSNQPSSSKTVRKRKKK